MDLMRPLEEWTEDEKRVLAESESAWTAIPETYERTKALRARVVAGAASFDRDDMVLALNAIEEVRILTHVILGIGLRKMEHITEYVSSAKCAYCEWLYRDVAADWPAEREITDDDLTEIHARVKVAIRDHVAVCPSHPMRELERRLAEAEARHA
ncbi:MAG TPA: hypothetical protein VFN76_09770 [Candidatus Limnocylindria bacterium]|nr:hypothetical protein [Candidatus Limnocylindria bacterium]